jgi:uncharacterized protein (TIGR02147 family)
VSVFQYLNVVEFLEAEWLAKRSRFPMFSLRAWSKRLGMNAHTPLQQMLKGTRKIPKRYVPALASSLNLGVREYRYFEALVDLSRAKSETERMACLKKLRILNPKQTWATREILDFSEIRDPLLIQILEITCLKSFVSDPQWIKQRLVQKVSVNTIRRSISVLKKLGLLVEGPRGLKKVHDSVLSRIDVVDDAVQEYHRRAAHLGADLLPLQSVLSREFNSISLNVNLANLSAARQSIRDFIKQFMADFDADTGDETCQS